MNASQVLRSTPFSVSRRCVDRHKSGKFLRVHSCSVIRAPCSERTMLPSPFSAEYNTARHGQARVGGPGYAKRSTGHRAHDGKGEGESGAHGAAQGVRTMTRRPSTERFVRVRHTGTGIMRGRRSGDEGALHAVLPQDLKRRACRIRTTEARPCHTPSTRRRDCALHRHELRTRTYEHMSRTFHGEPVLCSARPASLAGLRASLARAYSGRVRARYEYGNPRGRVLVRWMAPRCAGCSKP